MSEPQNPSVESAEPVSMLSLDGLTTAGHEIIVGDAVESLRRLATGSVHTVITSPPYAGLRDYGEDGQLGLEEVQDCLAWARSEPPCDDCYICSMRKVAKEIHRVLRDDGTLWWNIADSYNGSGGAGGDYGEGGLREGQPKYPGRHLKALKPKDLCMIPARTALAFQADGWYLRSDIVWDKPNPMPESVTDRPTKAHEYIFLFAKSKRYYYDADAIREPSVALDPMHPGYHAAAAERHAKGERFEGKGKYGKKAFQTIGIGGRNKRSVWRVTTKGYKGAHFAVYPTELIEPCVLAGTSEHGCCSDCGEPWKRLKGRACRECDALIPTQAKECAACGYRNTGWMEEREASETKRSDDPSKPGRRTPRKKDLTAKSITAGWRAGCECDADVVPCVVLDPFLGSGTTTEVALVNGRHAIGIELNPEYAELARERIAKVDEKLKLSDEREWV